MHRSEAGRRDDGLLLGGGLLAALLTYAAPAAAADLLPAMPTEPLPVTVTQWGGLYIGGQVGGAWSTMDWRFDNANYFNTLGPNVLGTDFDHDASGVLGGGQAGFNYQAGAWVLGIEGSATAADLRDSIQSPFFPGFDAYTTEASWLATVTGRVGYASDRWLAYAKGGWAGADLRLNFYEANTGIRASSTDWTNGWTVGGGVEYALGRALSLALEYDYVGLDTDGWTLPCAGCGSGVGGGAPVVDGDVAIQSVTARVNYRFGG